MTTRSTSRRFCCSKCPEGSFRRFAGSTPTPALAVTTLAPTSSWAASNDPLRPQQWGLDQVKADQAWARSTGTAAVVAVVDSGVDLNHPDLQGNLVPGATFSGCSRGQSPCGNGDRKGPDGVGNDSDEHGTHVSGIVAAVTGNSTGIAGVARNAKVMPIKVLEEGSGSFQQIADGSAMPWITEPTS